MKHTIEKVDGDHFIIDDNIHIKYVEQLGNDNGWSVFDKDSFYQIVYDKFEGALEKALNEKINKHNTLTPPVWET